jgi:hypothetical protein
MMRYLRTERAFTTAVCREREREKHESLFIVLNSHPITIDLFRKLNVYKIVCNMNTHSSVLILLLLLAHDQIINSISVI